MKGLVLSYLGLYLSVTLLLGFYRLLKLKEWSIGQFLFFLLILGELTWTSYQYGHVYADWQLLGFALGFTLLSSFFLYQSSQRPGNFTHALLFSGGRFLLHLQFILLIYLAR